jgi:branched-subunit amino acid transport protein
MSAMQWWIVILGAAGGSYVVRVAPFLWQPLHRFAQHHIRFLTYVSLAIAAGIVSRSVILSGGELAETGDIVIKLAGVFGALAFYRAALRSLPAALFAGAGFAVLLKWLAT